MRGRSCPLCHRPVILTGRGYLPVHLGDLRYPVSTRYAECAASGFSPEMAEFMRQNRDAGRHAYRCVDGTWIGPT